MIASPFFQLFVFYFIVFTSQITTCYIFYLIFFIYKITKVYNEKKNQSHDIPRLMEHAKSLVAEFESPYTQSA